MLWIDDARRKEKKRRIRAFLLSLIVPGLGQITRKRFLAGSFFFLVFFLMLLLVREIWQVTYGIFGTFTGLFLFYIVNLIDAYKGPSVGRSPCEKKCPAGINIPLYIRLIREGKFDEAFKIIQDKMPLPSVCGRICAHPCEEVCTLRKREGSIAIESIKRAASDFSTPDLGKKDCTNNTQKTVGIIGSGPAGLSAAYFLSRKGYSITIYERESVPGGLLTKAIPEFRLPHAISKKDIDRILDCEGIITKTGVEIGRDIGFHELKAKHPALLITTGGWENSPLNIPGEDLSGIRDALGFLIQVKEGKSVSTESPVVIIGGGNTAFDAARSAVRLGAKDVSIFYRRDETEMPGNREEREMATREGVQIVHNAVPMKFLGSKAVEEVEFAKTELEKNTKGKRSRIRIVEESTFRVKAGTVLLAKGQHPDISFLPSEIRQKIVKDSHISVQRGTMETSIPGLFAAGDVTGIRKSVVDAVDMGRRAAQGIDWFLNRAGAWGRMVEKLLSFDFPTTSFPPHRERGRGTTRIEREIIDTEKAVTSFLEVELGYSKEDAKKEAHRCLQCNKFH
jgi:NADH-quinone oxidoreductase subunit F